MTLSFTIKKYSLLAMFALIVGHLTNIRTQAFSVKCQSARGFARARNRVLSRNEISELYGGFGASLMGEKDPGKVKGTNLRVLKYPNPKLRAPNEEITEFDDTLKKTAEEMLLVMYASDGIGLAAPQVGINKRLMVFNDSPESRDQEKILINPKVIEKSQETDTEEEGCLSFPMINGDVVRSTWIKVQYCKINGEKVEEKLEGWPARIFQHEYDHLDSVLFIDRFGESDVATNKKRLEKSVKKYGPGGAP